jgi:hypothetical protein
MFRFQVLLSGFYFSLWISVCALRVFHGLISRQDAGHGFKIQFPSFKIHSKIQVRVSRCNFQVSRFTPRSRSGFQDAISKFQDSHQDPGQGFKIQFPSFKIHSKIQVRVSRCNFQVSRFTPRSRSGFQDAISKFQDSHQDLPNAEGKTPMNA